jgi:hypothetical protein
VKLKFLTVGAALAATLATTLVATNPASAYPPQGSLTVTTEPSGVDRYYLVNVTNVGGDCRVRVSAGGRTKYVWAGPQGQVEPLMMRFSRTGTFTVKVTTSRCPYIASTSTTLSVTDYDLRYRTSVRANRPLYIQLKGWNARQTANIRLWTTVGGQVVEQNISAYTNSRGDAKKRVRLTPAGTWAMLVTQGATSVGGSITVS